METPTARTSQSQVQAELPDARGRPDNHAASCYTAEGIPMIGRRIEIGCLVQGNHASCLWDTGSQLSLVSKDWLEEHLQEYSIQPVMDLINHPLTVEGVNGKPVPYAGVTALEFKLGLGSGGDTVLVPFLVCKVEMKRPINT